MTSSGISRENGRAYDERHMGKAQNVAALCRALEEAATER